MKIIRYGIRDPLNYPRNTSLILMNSSKETNEQNFMKGKKAPIGNGKSLSLKFLRKTNYVKLFMDIEIIRCGYNISLEVYLQNYRLDYILGLKIFKNESGDLNSFW